MDKKILNFAVSVYGNLEKYTETISKARCRIFYKYGNRNGTYITDEFAEKLKSSLPYTPIKGIYEEFDEDYTDHGKANSDGKIYGIVPENPNASWESHLDTDGITREYLCTDVLIFTALYKEANEIVSKPQSMEIYEPTMKGSWQIIEGRKYFVFTEGSFLGLQVLGDEVEPCFEGAAFYTLINSSVKELMEVIKDYELKIAKKENKGGYIMPKINFKLSDNEKYSLLWDLLNPNFTAESEWVMDYGICDIYDNYAVVKNYSTGNFERVYYTKDDNNITIGEKVVCYIVDVTDEEKTALDTIQKLNGSFTKAQEELGKILEIKEENSTFTQRNKELEDKVSALESDNTNYTKTITDLQADKDNLIQENETLKNYKLDIEKKEKEAVITKYSEQLTAEILDKYTTDLTKYSVSELERNLAFEYVNSNPSLFTKNDSLGKIPKNSTPKTGIEGILDKYK